MISEIINPKSNRPYNMETAGIVSSSDFIKIEQKGVLLLSWSWSLLYHSGYISSLSLNVFSKKTQLIRIHNKYMA